MVKKLQHHTLIEYIGALSARQPTPGGGSAAALTAALGVALLGMVARYSQGKGATKAIEKRIARIVAETDTASRRLLALVDEDADAYMQVVKARTGTAAAKKKANKNATRVPREVCRICYTAVDWAPYLVKNGNPHLVTDVIAATEMLFAAFQAAETFCKNE